MKNANTDKHFLLASRRALIFLLALLPVTVKAANVQADKLTDYIHSTYRISEDKANAIVNNAIEHGNRHALEPELILAIIAVESSYREKAVGPKGARGLMQVMPPAHPKEVKQIGGPSALFNAEKNISTGSKILAKYMRKSNGNLRGALLRYNGSHPRSRSRYPDKVLRYYGKLKAVVS